MKKIYILLLMFTCTFSLQAQTPELCNETKNTVTVTNTTTNTIDSVALPSTEIGNFTTPPTPPPPGPEEKVVVLLHGLTGSKESWAKARTHTFLNYKTSTPTPVYTQNFDIVDGISDIHDEINSANQDNGANAVDENGPYQRNQTIIIAHSLGGIMARFSDKIYHDIPSLQRQFGGFATFGSPHEGAPIIASIEIQNGNEKSILEKYLNNTCEVMAEPYLLELLTDLEDRIQDGIPVVIGSLFDVSINVFWNNFKTNLTTFKKNGCDVITSVAFSQLKASIAPDIGEELNPSSAFMADLNGFVTDTPGLAFYGIEDAPVSWREVYSLYNNVNNEDWGEANEDDEFINMANGISDDLFMNYEYNNLHIAVAPVFSLGDYLNCLANGGVYNTTTNLCEIDVSEPELADAYYDAWIWWNDFDRNYRIIFGHLTMELEETGTAAHCHCWLTQEEIDNGVASYDYINEPCSSMDNDVDVDGDICLDIQVPVYSLVEKDYPGDGVMPAYSARSFPGVHVTSIEMLGSNHQQLRNDENTKTEFFKMYNGDYGGQFKQAEKN